MTPALRKTLTVALLALALVLIALGAARTHKVFDFDSAQYDEPSFTKVSDKALIIDATFSGVERREGKLYSTYDRSAPRAGKQACPT